MNDPIYNWKNAIVLKNLINIISTKLIQPQFHYSISKPNLNPGLVGTSITHTNLNHFTKEFYKIALSVIKIKDMTNIKH